MALKRFSNEIYITFFYGITLFFSCSKKRESTHPSLQPLTESVYASGTIRSDSEYKVFVNASGLVAEIFVEEGQGISKGQAILKIENDNSSLNAQSSKIALTQEIIKEIRQCQKSYQ